MTAPPPPKRGFISAHTFDSLEVEYEERDGLALFEGDIILATEQRMEARRRLGGVPEFVGLGAGASDKKFRWLDRLIPFEIDPSLPNQTRVTDAIAHWEEETVIRFVKRTGTNANQYPDVVQFMPGNGCSSYVGRQGGMQEIILGSECTLGNVIHEIGHAVGLWHEQSREDRDTHVTVYKERVWPSAWHNFAQHISDGDDLGGYDYASILHYPKDAFAKQVGMVTIEPKVVGVEIGQRRALSAGDIAAVAALYP